MVKFLFVFFSSYVSLSCFFFSPLLNLETSVDQQKRQTFFQLTIEKKNLGFWSRTLFIQAKDWSAGFALGTGWGWLGLGLRHKICNDQRDNSQDQRNIFFKRIRNYLKYTIAQCLVVPEQCKMKCVLPTIAVILWQSAILLYFANVWKKSGRCAGFRQVRVEVWLG